jgi:hypothetical protein
MKYLSNIHSKFLGTKAGYLLIFKISIHCLKIYTSNVRTDIINNIMVSFVLYPLCTLSYRSVAPLNPLLSFVYEQLICIIICIRNYQSANWSLISWQRRKWHIIINFHQIEMLLKLTPNWFLFPADNNQTFRRLIFSQKTRKTN